MQLLENKTRLFESEIWLSKIEKLLSKCEMRLLDELEANTRLFEEVAANEERSEEESEELDYWLSLEDKALQLLDRQSDEDQEKSYLNKMKDVKILTQDTLPQQLYLEKSSIAEHCKAKAKENSR